MKTLLTAAALAIALAAPAAQARTAAKHHDGSQLSSAVQAKAGKKKTGKANKHKKHAKKGHKKSA